ncbi:hypothetical protein ABZX85_31410 [Streptomyces sp. NPDC004539]|uniref:hypothetical protein n=1 Tax=Streptomyces sp. NPDC004539 TaxID=3154280 RepID=UPI0033A480D5
MIKELLQQLMPTAFGGWTPDDGYADAEVTAVGDRLGTSLPDALLDYYAAAGRHPELMGMSGHEHTLRVTVPEHLGVEDGHLVFCGENRRPAQWSVRSDDADWPDPRVHGRSEPGGKWYSESRRPSSFVDPSRRVLASHSHNTGTLRVAALEHTALESPRERSGLPLDPT